MAGGVVAGVLGELTSSVTGLAVFFAAVATLSILGGGIVVALSYREETSAAARGSRLSVLSSMASTKMRARKVGAVAGAVEPGPLVAYAARFNDELDRCERLLGGSPSPADAVTARDRLVALVANSSYGAATRSGLIDENRVHEVSLHLAAAAAAS